MLKEGLKAPDFTLPDKDGNEVTLSKLIKYQIKYYLNLNIYHLFHKLISINVLHVYSMQLNLIKF